MLPSVSLDRLKHYRSQTFHSTQSLRVTSPGGAVDFVNERGFVFFWPIKNILFPSLWVAAAGDRPVPDEHDDPGHVTWDWKDKLMGKHRWFYSRLLRKRNTIISLDAIPFFYALSPNYGSPEEDYLIEYEEGRMPVETKMVYEALLKEGPLDTLALRRAARMTGPGSLTGFNRALETLQVDLRILPVGISDSGAWHYAFIYDLVHRHFPDLIERSGPISEYAARRTLLMGYYTSLGAAAFHDAVKLFGWRKEDALKEVEKLKSADQLIEAELEGQKDSVLAIPALVN